jgi:quinol monooxygenase YgiN
MMLIRIVRMTFQPGQTEAFLTIFRESQPLIRNFHGCRHLELWQDAGHPLVYCTYSHWENDAALEAYRQSELFRSTWARTKLLFAARPVAFSVYKALESDVEK